MEIYSKLSAEELRELLLMDKLLHEFMTEEDYTAILDIEAELNEPNEKIIDFCFTGLSALPKYDDINVRDFDISDLLKQNNIMKVKQKKTLKRLRFISVAVITLIFATLVLQMVCLALGFDLFGYFFNWNKPEVVEIKNNSIINSNDGEDIEIEYLTIHEIPVEMKIFVPDYIFNNFHFYIAYFIQQNNDKIHKFFFINEDENILSLIIKKSSAINIQKDDDGYFEEYSFGDNLFTIFTNTGDYQVFWIRDGYIYGLYTHFKELQDLKDVLDNLY